ncbi:MAG: hypothetical protein ABMB14_02430 [Myxococcota bacterium]
MLILAGTALAGGFGDPWVDFVFAADRILVGHVVRMEVVDVEHVAVTRITIAVEAAVFGPTTDRLVLTVPYDATTSVVGECFLRAAPNAGDDILFAAAPFARGPFATTSPPQVQLLGYVRSTDTPYGRRMVDDTGNFVGGVSCENGLAQAGSESESPWPTWPRSPWDGPDPAALASRQAAALDWTAGVGQVAACLAAITGHQAADPGHFEN